MIHLSLFQVFFSCLFVENRFFIVYGVVGNYYCRSRSMICMIFLIDLGR